jgi:ligand-binding SRPBCC domain-containing protein
MRYYELTDHFHVGADAEKTWAFFSSAENLATITPPWLNFTVQTKLPIEMRQDTLLDYTIRWSGVPVRWRTIITDWRPPHFFSDLQIRGPYAQWYHQHFFEPTAGGTDCRDRVIYALPFGPLGSITHALMVRRQLLEIFRFRRDVIGQHLGGIKPMQGDVSITRL